MQHLAFMGRRQIVNVTLTLEVGAWVLNATQFLTLDVGTCLARDSVLVLHE